MEGLRPVAIVTLVLALFSGPPVVGQSSLDDGDGFPAGEGSVLPQEADPVANAVASWTAVDMPTGYETRFAEELAEGVEGFSADHWGNLVRVVGSGSPRRIVACALDRPAHAVSQITEDGYLRLHRIGRGSRHPLWDQAFEAQQVRVLTPTGPVAGVIARSNGHFAQQHRNETAVVTADDLWLDVGAESATEVRRLGIGLLDPIARHLPPWPIPGGAAGPDVGRRAGCAAVVALAASAAGGSAAPGETHYVLSAQEGFGWVGLSSYAVRNGDFDAVVMVAPGQAARLGEAGVDGLSGRMVEALAAAGVSASSVYKIGPEVRHPGAHMEAVTTAEVEALARSVAARLEQPLGSQGPDWTDAPPTEPLRTGHFSGATGGIARTLTDLVELHGVPGHEWAVRRYVLDALPEWARERAIVDDVGNIIVAAGPDRDTTVFMAHLDEVGFSVAAIQPDGTVELNRLGGAVGSAWEGQTALLHFDPADQPSTSHGGGDDLDPRWKRASLSATAPRAPLRGFFPSRDQAREKDPGDLTVSFGLDGAGLRALGVTEGMMVTSHKEGLRMGRHRFVARALDDRAGTTALLSAIQRIDPDALPAKVLFTWSVHEEGGLIGAGAMARRYAAPARRIYSVDTFVSSDTPLETPHFAYAPLGDGPVLRAIENSGVSPDRERARVWRAAERAEVPLQMGLTQGGTDGTQFTFYGAPNQGLSWPGRYSHSPGEVLDLRDLARLTALIVELANTGG